MTNSDGFNNEHAKRLLRKRLRRWFEVAPLFDLKVKFPRREDALRRCADVHDLRKLAKRRVPQMVFDFVDGAAGSELSLTRARDRFSSVEFEPRVLRDVRDIDTSVEILGQVSALPFFLAPTGATRLMHHDGELAVARVAATAGIPYTLSTLGHTSIEDLTAAVPSARKWFQLYVTSDRTHSEEMIERASAAGIDTLLLAVDTPVPGRRNRDVRNGLVVPPKFGWRSVTKIVPYPYWWSNKLLTAPIKFPMVDAVSERPEQRMAKVMDPTVSISDLRWLRSRWPGKLVIKGLQSVDDAELVANCGVDAVYLSTHGGRQLDKAPVPYDLLPRVRERIDGLAQIFVDGGVMTGSDIVACLANGADAVGVGRAYLYGLMAGGEPGVGKAVQLLKDEIRTTLALVGCPSAKNAKSINVGSYR